MELERLLRAVRRRWYIALALLVIGAGLGSMAESNRTDAYTATSSVVVSADRTVYGSETVLERIVFNEMERMRSSDLVSPILDAVAPRSSVELAVIQRPESDVVDLVVSAADDTLATEIVNEWADSYVADIALRKTADLSTALSDMRANLLTVEAKLSAENARIQAELQRSNVSFNSLRAVLLSNPALAVERALLTQEARILRLSINGLQTSLNTIVPTTIISYERGPIAPERTGSGLGPIHGALIGLGTALGLISLGQQSSLSLRSAVLFSDNVWPISTRKVRRLSRRRDGLTSVGVEVLRNVSRERLPLVAFANPGNGKSLELRKQLADHFARLGFDVTVLSDELDSSTGDGVVVLPRDRLGEVVDLAVSGRSDLSRSLVFTDLGDLWSRRSIVKRTSVVALVNLDRRADNELASARAIARARVLAPSVLTVVS